METESTAPRREAYWRHIEGRSILSMSRTGWDAFEASSTNVALIDVAATPIGSVAAESSVLAAVAQQFSTGEGRISIYRHDANDSKPVNVDHYRVHLNIAGSPRLGEMITAASTSYNENMRIYLHQHVHLRRPVVGHVSGRRTLSVGATLLDYRGFGASPCLSCCTCGGRRSGAHHQRASGHAARADVL